MSETKQELSNNNKEDFIDLEEAFKEKKCLNCQYYINYTNIREEGFCEIHREDINEGFSCQRFLEAKTQIEIPRTDLERILRKK